MRSARRCVLVVAGWLAAVGTVVAEPLPAPSGGEPAFVPIGRGEGLTSSTIFAVLVDRHGFVWFAGDGGVHRYDGRRFHSFDRDPDRIDTLASRRNVALADTGDAIWIQGFGGMLQRFDVATGALTSHPLAALPARSPGARATLVSDATDALWIGTDIGLFRVPPRGRTAERVELGATKATPVTALAFDAASRRMLVAEGGALHAVALPPPHEAAPLARLPADTPSTVLGIAPAGDTVWLATDRGLKAYRAATGSIETIEHPLARERIDAIGVDADGAVWLGGVQRIGLTRYQPRQASAMTYAHHPDDAYSLASDRVNALAFDRRGDLWVGLLRDGANRVRVAARGIVRYRAPPGRGNSFCASHAMPDGRLLVALCGAGIGVLDPATGAFEDRRADLERALGAPAPALNSHAIVPDGEGGYWLPAALLPLMHWRPDGSAEAYPLLAHDGRAVPPVFMPGALRDRRGRVWVATRSGLARFDGPRQGLRLLDPATMPGRLFASGAIDVAEAGNGELWVGTSHGLVRFDPDAGSGERFVHDPADATTLSDDTVLAVTADRDGTIWAGTPSGLNRIADPAAAVPRFRRYGVAEGLPDPSVWAVGVDADGAVWAGTNRGIARQELVGDRFRAYLPGDGVPDANVNKQAFHAAPDGSLYVGTFAGLLRIAPRALEHAVPLPAVIGAFEAGGRRRINLGGPVIEAVETSYEQAHVRFELAAFGDPRGLSYRLVGLDGAWQDVPPDLVVAFDPLPPGQYRFEVRQHASDGTWLAPSVALPVRVAPPPWRSPAAYGLYALASGGALALALVLTARRRADDARHLAELSRLANYDTLTQLPNRTRFAGHLVDALRDGAAFALFYIDLDRFKNINDSLGHAFGDRLIVAAARRLRGALPPGATLARVGGDEFTAIVPRLRQEPEAGAAARAVLEAFAVPLDVDGHAVVITPSVGISLAPTHALDAEALVQYADSAMYYAKDAGRNTYRFFQPRMVAQVSRRLALELGLRHAIARGEIDLAFQPKIDLARNEVAGAEVLLRWHSAEHGVVDPAEFVPILEDTGLIEPVGLWVMQRVCSLLGAWRTERRAIVPLSVNVSVHQLARGDLTERIAQLLIEHAVPRDTLELELTESAIMDNAEQMDAALRELRDLGLRLSIDDFGTGYSSLAYLSHLPVDKLKIDRRFVEALGERDSAGTLCSAIVAMAHSLGLAVVGEGVETERQHRQLAAMGCDEAQGYLYARPMPAAALGAFIEARSTPTAGSAPPA